MLRFPQIIGLLLEHLADLGKNPFKRDAFERDREQAPGDLLEEGDVGVDRLGNPPELDLEDDRMVSALRVRELGGVHLTDAG